jgi:hypothetical protein
MTVVNLSIEQQEKLIDEHSLFREDLWIIITRES